MTITGAVPTRRATTGLRHGDLLFKRRSMQGNIKVFSGSAHPEFSRRICEHLGLPLGHSK